jgi:hypothetical protein
MIRVWVRRDQQINLFNVKIAQSIRQLIWSCIDKGGRPLGSSNQDRVALTHIEKSDLNRFSLKIAWIGSALNGTG